MADKNKKQATEDVWENPEAIASQQISKTEKFITENKALVSIGLSILALIVVGVLGYRYYISAQNEEAQSEMFQSVFYYEQDSLEMALRGDGNYLGLVQIADDYSNTKAGNLANFYVGSIYVKQGKYETAIPYLEDFSGDDFLLQARAYSLLGDVYANMSNYNKALDYYKQAIGYKPNKEFTPIYLKKAAVASEKNNDVEGAKSYYKQIIDKFTDSEQYLDAQKHYARLGGEES